MIRYLGLGLEEAYHPWSENGYTFTAQELLDHFINVVLPLEKTSDLPTEAPTTAPPLPTLQAVGTISQLALEKEQTSREEDEKFKVDAKAKLDLRQEQGIMDIWSELQQTIAPTAKELKNMVVEVAFEYPGEDGTICLDWYHVTVEKVVNEKKCLAKIKWHAETLAENDVKVSVQQLTPSPFCFNPKKLRKNTWREYITR